MADTFSATLGVALMQTGNDNNTWGTICNTSVFQIFEDSIANVLTETVTGGSVDLSGSAPPAGPSQTRYAAIIVNGVLGSDQSITVPNLTKFWWVSNQTSGAHNVFFKPSGGSLSTAIPQNSGWQLMQCDGAGHIIVSPVNNKTIQMPDGSLSFPAYSNVNEPSSGWYRAGTQDWRLALNGADVFQVTGAGALSPYAHNALGYGGFGPLVPPGAEMSYPGITPPTGWVLEFGQAVSRPIANGGSVDTYKGVWGAIVATVVGSTNNNTAVTGLGTDMRFKGLNKAFVEGTGITAGTTITFTGATTGTLSVAASGSNAGITLRLFPHGQGDGSTTFNIPNRCDVSLIGRGDMNGASDRGLVTVAGGNFDATLLATSRNNGDVPGGAQNQTLGVTQIPLHTHSGSTGNNLQDHTHPYNGATSGLESQVGGGPSTGTTALSQNTSGASNVHQHAFTTDGGTGGALSHPNMPPSGVTNWIMKL